MSAQLSTVLLMWQHKQRVKNPVSTTILTHRDATKALHVLVNPAYTSVIQHRQKVHASMKNSHK